MNLNTALLMLLKKHPLNSSIKEIIWNNKSAEMKVKPIRATILSPYNNLLR